MFNTQSSRNTLHLQRLPTLLCLLKLRDHSHVRSRFSPGLQPASKQCQVQLLVAALTDDHELVGQILQVIITCTCFEMPSLFSNHLAADSSRCNIVSINTVTQACSSSYQGKKGNTGFTVSPKASKQASFKGYPAQWLSCSPKHLNTTGHFDFTCSYHLDL